MLMVIIRSLVTNIWILGSICTCLETARKMRETIVGEASIILWAKGGVDLTWSEVEARSRPELSEDRSPEDFSDFFKDSEEQSSRLDDYRVCYRTVKAVRPLSINKPQRY